LLHMLQVKPLALRDTLVTCAEDTIEMVMANNESIFFMVVLFI
jgi:hypothetical protein